MEQAAGEEEAEELGRNDLANLIDRNTLSCRSKEHDPHTLAGRSMMKVLEKESVRIYPQDLRSALRDA